MICKHDLTKEFCDYCNGKEEIGEIGERRVKVTTGAIKSRLFELLWDNKEGCDCGNELVANEMACFINGKLSCRKCCNEN